MTDTAKLMKQLDQMSKLLGDANVAHGVAQALIAKGDTLPTEASVAVDLLNAAMQSEYRTLLPAVAGLVSDFMNIRAKLECRLKVDDAELDRLNTIMPDDVTVTPDGVERVVEKVAWDPGHATEIKNPPLSPTHPDYCTSSDTEGEPDL